MSCFCRGRIGSHMSWPNNILQNTNKLIQYPLGFHFVFLNCRGSSGYLFLVLVYDVVSFFLVQFLEYTIFFCGRNFSWSTWELHVVVYRGLG